MTIPFGPGSDLAGLDKTLHKIIVCTVTGGGLTADHVYCANVAADAWIDISSIADHGHTTGSGGGELINIFRQNPLFMDTGAFHMINPSISTWTTITQAGASVADDTDGTTDEHSIKLATGATSGTNSSIKGLGPLQNFSKRSIYQCKLRIGTASSVAVRSGPGMQAFSATDDNQQKYGWEACTTVNNNWFIRTADGSARSAADTGTAFTANRVAMKIDHYPDLSKVDGYLDSGSAFTKTTDTPISSTSPTLSNSPWLYRANIKNNSASDRTLFVYGVRLKYTMNSTTDNWR